jgi:hypothetical protein
MIIIAVYTGKPFTTYKLFIINMPIIILEYCMALGWNFSLANIKRHYKFPLSA